MQPTRGYLEGYYGRLLGWEERAALLAELAVRGLNAYVYAPKEDVCHRLCWRRPYDSVWRDAFRAFCADAKARGIDVIAGVAPGIDFAFASLKGGADLDIACEKLARLRSDGASRLMLLMDDIDADFAERNPGQVSEGEAHALLANRLGERLEASLVVVPRVYAGELARDDPDYLADFVRVLASRHDIAYCGPDIVSRTILPENLRLPGDRPERRVILWDNLYANDYCPRRLFVGSWFGRTGIQDVWLNGTGMPETDRLLLALMAGHEPDGDDAPQTGTRAVLRAFGVPAAFDAIADALACPMTNDRLEQPLCTLVPDETVLASIDELLWRWKTALSREWYPFLMGLRQDLLLSAGKLSANRIRKTQTPPLARQLLAGDA